MEENNTFEEIVFNAKGMNPQVCTAVAKYGDGKQHEESESFSFERRFRRLTDKEKAELEKEYSVVVVNDYDDEYHLSDKEREEKFKYYQAFAKIRKCKRKYRKLDDFVKVFRLCLDCLKVVAESNGVYDPEKFIKLVLADKIQVFGLNFPKYVGRDKKEINWKYVSEFITDPSKDVSELSKTYVSELDELSDEELAHVIMSDEELRDIVSSVGNEPDVIQTNPDDNFIEKYGICIPAGKKELKQLVQIDPMFLKSLKEAEKSRRQGFHRQGILDSFVFNLRQDDFDRIAEIDAKRGYTFETDMPKFKGDIMNDDDYKLYLKALDDYEMTQIKVNYHGKMRTQEEINEIELTDALQAAGWNVRALYDNKETHKKLKKIAKRNKEREAKLKAKLLAVQEKQKSVSATKAKLNAKKKKKKKKHKEED